MTRTWYFVTELVYDWGLRNP